MSKVFHVLGISEALDDAYGFVFVAASLQDFAHGLSTADALLMSVNSFGHLDYSDNGKYCQDGSEFHDWSWVWWEESEKNDECDAKSRENRESVSCDFSFGVVVFHD